jgi:hypothetical protein
MLVHHGVPLLVRPNNRSETIHEIAQHLKISKYSRIHLLLSPTETARRKEIMILYPLEWEAATLDDDGRAIGAQDGVPVCINFWRPQNDGLQAFLSLGKNPIPIVLIPANGLLEHIKEPTSLGKRNPSIFFCISLGLRTLYPEDVKEQIEGGDYSEVGRHHLKGAKKRQRVGMEL